MTLPGLFMLGFAGWALYQATQSTAAPGTSTSTSDGVGIRGLTVPPGVTLSSTDVAVARWIIDPSVKFVLGNGTATQTRPTHGNYLELAGLSAAKRLAALQYGVNLMGRAPQEGVSLFDAIGGF